MKRTYETQGRKEGMRQCRKRGYGTGCPPPSPPCLRHPGKDPQPCIHHNRFLVPCFLQTRARVGYAVRTRRVSKTPRHVGSVGLAGVALSPRRVRKSLAGTGREREPFRKPLAGVGYFRKPFRKPFENRWQEWENREFYFSKK